MEFAPLGVEPGGMEFCPRADPIGVGVIRIDRARLARGIATGTWRPFGGLRLNSVGLLGWWDLGLARRSGDGGDARHAVMGIRAGLGAGPRVGRCRVVGSRAWRCVPVVNEPLKACFERIDHAIWRERR